jgi:hypothetical protein
VQNRLVNGGLRLQSAGSGELDRQLDFRICRCSRKPADDLAQVALAPGLGHAAGQAKDHSELIVGETGTPAGHCRAGMLAEAMRRLARRQRSSGCWVNWADPAIAALSGVLGVPRASSQKPAIGLAGAAVCARSATCL